MSIWRLYSDFSLCKRQDGIDGVETIIMMLASLQLKAGVATVLFVQTVCEMAVEVKQKRADKIIEINNLTGYTEAQKNK